MALYRILYFTWHYPAWYLYYPDLHCIINHGICIIQHGMCIIQTYTVLSIMVPVFDLSIFTLPYPAWTLYHPDLNSIILHDTYRITLHYPTQDLYPDLHCIIQHGFPLQSSTTVCSDSTIPFYILQYNFQT